MRCLRCQHANDATARFCEECGARLSDYTCVACGAELRASTRFCPSCGTQVGSTADRAPAPDPRAYTPQHLAAKILQSNAALEGERKQVTVLFADVKGSMELAEQLDPEVFHRVMERFATLLAAESIASRAPSPTSRATASWRSSARRSRTRTMRGAPATRRST